MFLSYRQQQHLIELLAKLECKAPFKGSIPSPSPRLSPVKATVPFPASASSVECQSEVICQHLIQYCSSSNLKS